MNEPILAVQHLKKQYEGRDVLSDVSFSLEEGDAIALVGPHGAGKTTLFRILADMALPDEGSVSLFGCTGKKELREARQQTGFLVDAPFCKKALNVEKNLLLLAGLYGKPDKRYIRKRMKQLMISELDVGRRKAGKLTETELARYAFAAAVAHKPKLLVLDDPLAAIHTDDLERVCDFLHQQREEGNTLLISGHDVARLRLVCSQVLYLRDGVLTGPMPFEDLPGAEEEAEEKD